MEKEGIRLNKFISDAGICSRREADRLIESGRVEIQRKTRKGEPPAEAVRATLGERVMSGDTVFVNGRELPKKQPGKVYYLYNKPAGVICTTDRNVPENIIDAAGIPQRVTYAGRLDKDSGGLLVLTNDGELIDRMMRASSYHEKQYVVSVDRAITQDFLSSMREGVKILVNDEETLRRHPGGLYVTTRPCRVRQTEERKFEIILTQGFNRQIRRMCSALGYGVSSITRTRVMNLRLGDLKSGETRRLTRMEVEELLETSGKRAVIRRSERELKAAGKAARRAHREPEKAKEKHRPRGDGRNSGRPAKDAFRGRT